MVANNSGLRYLLLAVLLLVVMNGCMSMYPKKHGFTSSDVRYKFKWGDEKLISQKLNTSDSGVYVALINDSLCFNKRIRFGKFHDFFINGLTSFLPYAQHGIFNLSEDLINVEYYDEYSYTWHPLFFRIKDRNEIVMLANSTKKDSMTYVYYDFKQPIRSDYNPYMDVEALWLSPEDYNKWINSQKSFIYINR